LKACPERDGSVIDAGEIDRSQPGAGLQTYRFRAPREVLIGSTGSHKYGFTVA
jgi:hypothetical protein